MQRLVRAVLDKLQCEVIMGRDNLALRGFVAITVPVSVNEQKANGCAQVFSGPSRKVCMTVSQVLRLMDYCSSNHGE